MFTVRNLSFLLLVISLGISTASANSKAHRVNTDNHTDTVSVPVNNAIPSEDSDRIKLIRLARSQFPEPLVATSATSPEEDAALIAAIQQYQNRSSDDDYHALTEYLAARPNSGWQVSLLTNLGLAYYQAGRFSSALDAWEKAWRLGKDNSELYVKKQVDRAVGELARFHARIGHADRLEALFAEMGERVVSGSATETITGAREGLWLMRHDPGIAYLCGPMALKSLLISQGASAEQIEIINQFRSGPHGVSLTEVGKLAEQVHMPYTLIQRDRTEPVPVPSVVHWKVSHYAAIVGENQGRYHIQDPIFGQDLWVTKDAIDNEASGYFLVPSQDIQSGWRKIQVAEADLLFGMGIPTGIQPGFNRPQDPKAKCPSPNKGMCNYNFSEMEVSLNLNDTPVGYQPSKGPAVYTTLTYNQRDAIPPSSASYFNVGQKWTLNWLSYIHDVPSQPGYQVIRYVAGGGGVNYNYLSNGQFSPENYDQSVLTMTSNPVGYKRQLPDGSVEIYSQASTNSPTATDRLFFLTQQIDPAGNAITLYYDNDLRLTKITDASRRDTNFSYDNTKSVTDPLYFLIRQITDPFGRTASLGYDSSGRLNAITDVIGMKSNFGYDSGSFITSMTTAYGTTNFGYSEDGMSRTLYATDPLGYTERLETQAGLSSIPYSEANVPNLPNGSAPLFNRYLNYRVTYYWDKYAYQQAYNNGTMDYTKARMKHWVHYAQNGNLQLITSEPLESVKYPLESRIWYTYPGQPVITGVGAGQMGTFDQPNLQARLLDDGTTQLLQYSYNSFGKITSSIDAIGRETQITYDTNHQVDPIQITQKTADNSYSTIAQYTYNSQHLPLSYTDAAGQTTYYNYNSAGQLTQVKDPLGQITTYNYNPLGYLTSIINPIGKTQLHLTYDAYGRVASRTDSEGYTLNYSYDKLDRITKILYPDGTSETTQWNKLDPVAVTDRLGRQTLFNFDAVRNRVSQIDPMGFKTQYRYYPNQTLESLIDPKGNVTSWSRDIQSRVTAKHFANGRSLTYAYENTTSRLKSVTDSLGQSKNYTYALDDRLTNVNYHGAVNPTPDVSLSYDPWFPRLVSMTDGTGATQYQYQPTGQLGALKLSQVDGPYQNDTINYQYDELGRSITRTVDISSESYSYDYLSRPIDHINPLGEFTQSYLGQSGQLTGLQLLGSAIGTTWQYDINKNDRRLLDIVNSSSGVRSYGYVTNAENIIQQISETATGNAAKNWMYSYDADDRLNSAADNSGNQYTYTYDTGDNLTSRKLATASTSSTTRFYVNDVNQLIVNQVTPNSYDANGNLVSDKLRNYKWDAENRLVQVSIKAQPGVNYQFRYDGTGHRVAIVSNTASSSTETRYLWCGDSLCQTRNASDTVTRRYYPEGEYLPLSNTQLFYNRDHLGSVRDVTDEQTGNKVATYDYDPYGAPTSSSGTQSTDLRYAGMFYLQGAGLYLTKYRAYDSGTGRWISRDPIGEAGGINLYTYVRNNPLRWTDRTGLIPVYNGTDSPIVVSGGSGPGEGHDPGIPTQAILLPGQTVDHNNPITGTNGELLYDVDAIDYNGNGVAEPPSSYRDITALTGNGEKVVGDDSGFLGLPLIVNVYSTEGATSNPIYGVYRLQTNSKNGCNP